MFLVSYFCFLSTFCLAAIRLSSRRLPHPTYAISIQIAYLFCGLRFPQSLSAVPGFLRFRGAFIFLTLHLSSIFNELPTTRFAAIFEYLEPRAAVGAGGCLYIKSSY